MYNTIALLMRLYRRWISSTSEAMSLASGSPLKRFDLLDVVARELHEHAQGMLRTPYFETSQQDNGTPG
jgi:hypothetical protein